MNPLAENIKDKILENIKQNKLLNKNKQLNKNRDGNVRL